MRCAAHSGPRFRAATFGTSEWDEAAAEYASTPSGAAALAAVRTIAMTEGDVEYEVALTHAMDEEERYRGGLWKSEAPSRKR